MIIKEIMNITGNNGVTCRINKEIVNNISMYVLYVEDHGSDKKFQDKDLEYLIGYASASLN